jgi:hypothetical protein
MAMACVTPPKAYDFDPVHIFAHPRADVWLAVMDLGVQRNWTIKAVEPEAGHVVFEVVEVDRDAADCGRVPFGVTSGMPSVGISFTVRGDDSSAGVRVSIRVMRPYQVGEHEGMTRCESTGMMERMIGEWLQAILDGPLQGHHLAAVDGLLTVGLPYYTTRL